ncbi:MAG TPA: multidrug ABC transporter ATP-binding protein, partial [Firmicutes bacterium]|nr:multidrug ABC transporter ATP-binding protein [Bacillota bacterium]
EVSGDLAQPAIMAKIVDQEIAQGNLTLVLKYGLLMVGIASIGLIGGWGCTIASSIASMNFGADLRTETFKKIQEFSFANLDQFKTESLITRLTNDVLQIQHMVLMSLRMMVRAPFLCIGSLIMVFAINIKMALILAVAMPLLFTVVFLIIRKGFPLFNLVQEKLDKVNGVMRENLSGARVIKAFVRADFEKKRFAQANNEQIAINMKASRLMILMQPLMMTIMNLSIVAVLWFGGRQVAQGSLMVGEIIALLNYFSRILFSLMMITFMLMGASRAKVSADRINEVLETKVEITDPPDASTAPINEGKVVFEDVTFQYQGAGGQPVLKKVCLTASPGQVVAILGATGSGKSTLVNLIPRLYEPTAGRILIDGRDLKTIQLRTLRTAVRIALQESILFSGSIKDNIRWGKADASDAEVVAAAQAAHAHDFIMSLPDGYETQLGRRGVNLSGGQKQRLAIARAIIKKPSILILDDSTSAVDLKTEYLIQQSLKKLMKETTCFIIAQRISAVLEADQIILLEEGKIVGSGDHEELLRVNPIYQDIYRSQLEKEGVANG